MTTEPISDERLREAIAVLTKLDGCAHTFVEMQRHIEKRVSIVPITGCWMWMSTIDSGGYGRVGRAYPRHGGTFFAHRLSFAAAYGELHAGMEVDHLCRNTWCVNPSHLEEVPPVVNNRRSMSPSARNGRKTHCPIGHGLSGSNLMRGRFKRSGERECRICHNARSLRRWRRRAKEER